MELELRHLRVICTIAETGSLTRAAAALQLTQPGLSAQLRRIEGLLGGELFSRTRSGAVPTAFGEVVLTRARAVLPTVDELVGVSALAAQTGHSPQRFRLGSVNAPLLGGLVSAMEVPGIAVRPILGNPLWYRHLLAWHRDGPLAPLGPVLARYAAEAYRSAAARSPAYRRWLERHPSEAPPLEG